MMHAGMIPGPTRTGGEGGGDGWAGEERHRSVGGGGGGCFDRVGCIKREIGPQEEKKEW